MNKTPAYRIKDAPGYTFGGIIVDPDSELELYTNHEYYDLGNGDGRLGTLEQQWVEFDGNIFNLKVSPSSK